MEKIASILERIQVKRSSLKSSCGEEAKEYACPVCRDRGVIVEGDQARICNCQKQKRVERLFKTSQITPAFRAKSFENFELAGRPRMVKDMFECAKDYAAQFEELRRKENNWLVLLGEPGSGKTHLSMAVANALLSKGVAVLYFQHIEGMGELKDALRSEDEGRISEKLAQMKKVELLMWDDLFKGHEPRPFELEVTFEVLNYRYLNLLPTVISSEKTPAQLLAIDEAIGSRIIERGKGHIVVVQGREANYRLKA